MALIGGLLAWVVELVQTVSTLREENARLKEEIARLRHRPRIRPSVLEKPRDPKPPSERNKGRPEGKMARLEINETRILRPEVPAGSRFKGYQDFIVQDVVIRPHVILLRRERRVTPAFARAGVGRRDGDQAAPARIQGSFRAGAAALRAPAVYRGPEPAPAKAGATVPRAVSLLHNIGIVISKRQVVRLLIDDKESFLDEARDVLRAGLETAAWITADDTGARHKGRSGFCTQIGNDHFTWFGTTASKSRLNFLELLRAG
jgi:hypothetical protein